MNDFGDSYGEAEIQRNSKKCIPRETTLYNVELATAYVPFQKFCGSLSPEEGLRVGTIFPELVSPYEKPSNKKRNAMGKWRGIMDTNYRRAELLKQITALDFTIVDLNLFLNTHPMDQTVIAHFNTCLSKSNMLKEKYSKEFGMLTVFLDQSPYPWQWINEPWPWEYESNFEFWGKE